MPVTKKMSKKTSGRTAPKARAVDRYFRGTGRRKLAVAGAKIYASGNGGSERKILVNGKDYKDYFSLSEMQDIITAPLEAVQVPEISKVLVVVRGGGVRGQAEATRLGIARALVIYNPDLKKSLRDTGYLTRDARIVERKKAGLKKARRAPQFSKR